MEILRPIRKSTEFAEEGSACGRLTLDGVVVGGLFALNLPGLGPQPYEDRDQHNDQDQISENSLNAKHATTQLSSVET